MDSTFVPKKNTRLKNSTELKIFQKQLNYNDLNINLHLLYFEIKYLKTQLHKHCR